MSEQQSLNSLCITQVASTICDVLGVPAPSQADNALPIVKTVAQQSFHQHADRVFMYNPDAVALWLYQKYTPLFHDVLKHTQLALPLLSVMPSVTPVCFGSMYTGVMPVVHGIQSYIKPVIKNETVFDALLKNKKKPCIVSTANDSLSMIFLEREMDYFIYETIEECNQKALALIEEDQYDFILLYNGNFDGTMHRYGPESTEALAALENNVATFATVAEAIKKHWVNHHTLLGFAPDHGCHRIDGDLGSHGLEMPEDMNIIHFYGFIPHQ